MSGIKRTDEQSLLVALVGHGLMSWKPLEVGYSFTRLCFDFFDNFLLHWLGYVGIPNEIPPNQKLGVQII